MYIYYCFYLLFMFIGFFHGDFHGNEIPANLGKIYIVSDVIIIVIPSPVTITDSISQVRCYLDSI